MPANREEAWQLLTEWVGSESLRRHMLAVEAAMRAYSQKYGGDREIWSLTGLLHDFDYERYPTPDPVQKTGHPFHGVKLLREKGYPEEIIQAILGHALYSGVPRETPMAKCLFACDELCGFIVAIGRMRPDGLKSVTPDVVRKYLKRQKFAEKVSREEIAQGIAELGVPEDEHYATVIRALQEIAGELGFRNENLV